jgi:flavin reductase (DIM6/NTAB) family NADH-FMN oxidoreductase RutF
VTAADFHALVSSVDYPMFVVTAAARGRRAGCLVGFVTQASIAPPRLLVMVSKQNHTYRVAGDADLLVVHFLHAGNADLARLFGEQTGDGTDKFHACDWDEGPRGTPVLRGTAGWVAGRILARFDGGDHVAHLLDIQDAAVGTPGPPLTFQSVRDMRPGHPA